MKDKTQFDKEIILLERSFIDCEPIDDGELGAEVEETMLDIIAESDYLAATTDREKQIFHKLAAVCVTLTQHAKGEVSVCLYPNADEALIFITAPTFELSAADLGKLYNVVIGASSMIIDTVKDSGEVCVTIGFSFRKDAVRIIDLFAKLDEFAEKQI